MLRDGANGLDRNIDNMYYAASISVEQLNSSEDYIIWWVIPWEYQTIVDKLNIGTVDPNFIWEKINGINNGYPILKGIDQSKQ